jgi:hypothetical protein
MGGGVDAERQAAGDGQASSDQMGGETVRGFPAERGGIAATDDGQLRRAQAVRVAMDEQQGRGIGDLPQQQWIAGIVQPQQMVAGLFQPGQVLVDRPPVGIVQIGERNLRQFQPEPFGPAGGEYRRRRTEMLQQPGEPRRPDARRSQQRQ